MDTTKDGKLKKKINKLTNQEIEERQWDCLLQNATYSREVMELELNHNSLLRCRMIELSKKEEDREENRLGLIDQQIKAVEEEISRIEKLQKSNVDAIKIFQEVLASRIGGKNDKARTILGWVTGIGATALGGVSLWFGYKRDIDGTMRNKSPLSCFEKFWSMIRIGK